MPNAIVAASKVASSVGQGERVADDVNSRPGRPAYALLGHVDHPRREVHAEHPAVRADPVREVRGDLARAARDVERRLARLDARAGRRAGAASAAPGTR